jgi:hypothetical protein
MQSPLASRLSRGAVRASFLATLALALLAVLFSFRQPAQAQTIRPKVVFERTVTPSVINVREMIRRAGTTDLAEGMQPAAREIPFGRITPPSTQVGQTSGARGPAARRVSRAPEVTFDTIPSNGGEPSDDGIAVGPDNVVSAANVSWGVYSRTGTELFRVPFLTWYQGLDNTGFIFDPRVDYDENTGRFYLVTVGLSNNPNLAELQVSISQTSDPLGNWHRYVFNVRESNPDQWGDFPCWGFNNEAMYCTTNNFEFGAAFTHTSLRIFSKAQMLSGSPVTPRLLTFDNAFTVQPVTSHDDTNIGWMLERFNLSTIRIWKVTNSLTANPAITITNVNVAPFSIPPVMAQSGSTRTLDGGDSRTANATLRNGQMWMTHGAGGSGGTRGVVRVYHFNPAGNGSLVQQYEISDPALNLHWPSLEMDQFGAILVGYATANANIFPSMHYSIKRPSDTAFSAPTLLKAGTIAYDTGGTGTNRWGDYTDCAWDPAQPNIVWHSGQIAQTQTLWVKHVGAVKTTPQSITVTEPNGNEVLERGVSTDIEWTSVSFTAPHTVKIELLDTVAVTTTLLAAAAPETSPGVGSFTWTPDNGLPLGKRYKIRITSNEDPTFFDESNNTFSVQAGSIEVLAPNGGEVVVVGNPLNIQWDAQDFAGQASTPAVRVELSRDGGGTWEILFANAPNTGAIQWIATADPVTEEGTLDALIRVTAANSGLTFEDESDAPFEIRLPSEITVLEPGEGAFNVGSVLNISWERQGFVGGVKVEVSRNAGASYETLFPDVDGQTDVQWAVTGPATKLGRIRVSSLTEPDVVDLSTGVFEIVQQSITVTAPKSGAKTLTGLDTTVTWTSKGIAPTDDVVIEVSLDGGGTFEELVSLTENDGSESAELPGAAPNALIRVSLASDPAVFGLSSSFSISDPTLFLVSPNGGNPWKVGTQEVVQWSGTVLGHGQVILEISRDNGATWGPLGGGGGLTANDGAQSVGVAGPAAKKVLVRVSWTLGNLSDVSDAGLQISEAKKKKKGKK